MRGGIAVLLIFLVCLVLMVLYIFLGRTQVQKQIDNLKEQDTALQAQLDEVRAMEDAIPKLMERLPTWSRQLAMFAEAIPPEIDDHVFFANLAKQTETRNVQILKLDTMVGQPWLGQITETMEEELTSLGINVNAARNIKVAFYNVTLVGEFDDVLAVFENLKQYNRLYTVNLISGPAQTAGGTTAEVLSTQQTPLNISGSLYYGISEEEVSQETLAALFGKAISGPAARAIFGGVCSTARDLTKPDEDTATKSSDAAPDQANDNRPAEQRIVAAATAVQEDRNR